MRIELRHREVKELAQDHTVNGRAGFKFRVPGLPSPATPGNSGLLVNILGLGEPFLHGDSLIYSEV